MDVGKQSIVIHICHLTQFGLFTKESAQEADIISTSVAQSRKHIFGFVNSLESTSFYVWVVVAVVAVLLVAIIVLTLRMMRRKLKVHPVNNKRLVT